MTFSLLTPRKDDDDGQIPSSCFPLCQVDLGTMPHDHSNTHLQQGYTHHPVTQNLKLRVPLSFGITPGFSSMEHERPSLFTHTR